MRQSTRVYTTRVGDALTAPGTPVKDRRRFLPFGSSKRVTTRPSTFTAPPPSLYSAPHTTLLPAIAGPAAAMPGYVFALACEAIRHAATHARARLPFTGAAIPVLASATP